MGSQLLNLQTNDLSEFAKILQDSQF